MRFAHPRHFKFLIMELSEGEIAETADTTEGDRKNSGGEKLCVFYARCYSFVEYC